jgi:hypothetical protein
MYVTSLVHGSEFLYFLAYDRLDQNNWCQPRSPREDQELLSIRLLDNRILMMFLEVEV